MLKNKRTIVIKNTKKQRGEIQLASTIFLHDERESGKVKRCRSLFLLILKFDHDSDMANPQTSHYS